MKHVVLGAGAAGIAAARTIRRLRPQDEIAIVSSDGNVYSRCMLHHFLSGRRKEEELRFVPENFFEEHRILWLSGTTVSGIDTRGKNLRLDGDGTFSYDTLLIAAGAISSVPPVGALRTAPNVFGLRDLADARAIRKAAESAEDAVIVGSGLVGLDAAYALLELGKRVTVVEAADRILPLQLDAHAASAYQSLFEAHGCTFRLGVGAQDTECGEKGDVTALLLASGERLPCGFVVTATGVRPATAFLKDGDIEAGHGIKVDTGMRTSVKDVYAAGDVTGLSGIWPNAVKQGEVAGRNMCGGAATYSDTYALKNTINFFGLATLSLGRTGPAEGDEIVTREDRSRYEKLILRDGAVRGVLLQGDISNSGFWQHLVKNGIDVSARKSDIWKLSYSDFYALDEQGQYIYAI